MAGAMAYIRRTYGVPAKRGGRVKYTGVCGRDGVAPAALGTIRSARGGRLRIQLDGARHVLPFHPTWELAYLDGDGQAIDRGAAA